MQWVTPNHFREIISEILGGENEVTWNAVTCVNCHSCVTCLGFAKVKSQKASYWDQLQFRMTRRQWSVEDHNFKNIGFI